MTELVLMAPLAFAGLLALFVDWFLARKDRNRPASYWRPVVYRGRNFPDDHIPEHLFEREVQLARNRDNAERRR